MTLNRLAASLLAGSLAVGEQRALPTLVTCLLVSCGASVALYRRVLRVPAALLLGYAWTALAAQLVIADRLGDERWNEAVTATLTVSEFPRETSGRTLFTARLVEPAGLPRLVRLAWYEPRQRLALGETWRLRIRLRPPRGFANPGSFDYERWLFLRGIGATGYVIDAPVNTRLTAAAAPLTARLRRAIVARLQSVLPNDAATSILIAIAVGSRHAFSPETHRVFVDTGTSHLMAISGLHIGISAGIGLLAGRALGAFLGAAHPLLAPRPLGAFAALACAFCYAVLAGLALPTRRACLMLAIALTGWVAGRQILSVRSYALTILIILMLWPLDALTVTFRLSFAAVGILLLLHHRDAVCLRARRAAWRTFVRWQLLLSVLSFPLTLALFGRLSLIGPLANLAVIPWFSFVVVPLLAIALVLPFGLSEPAMQLVHLASATALRFLSALASLPAAAISLPSVTLLSQTSAIAGAVALVIPWPWTYRLVLLGILLPQAIPPGEPRPAPGCFRLSLFDVGQGQAALVETASGTLLYDTGPRFSATSDAAQIVLVPALEAMGVRTIDEVIVSHGDSDHSGGLRTLLAERRIKRVRYSGATAAYPSDAIACRRGQDWEWSGVRFRFLHPSASFSEGNDASCVLRVSSGPHAVLLTGDIEKRAERALLEYDAAALNSMLVVVPHHGSATSSSSAFVRAVMPEHAWVAAAYRNRWGFPKPDVVERWRRLGASVQTTGGSGMLSARICSDSPKLTVSAYRAKHKRFWN